MRRAAVLLLLALPTVLLLVHVADFPYLAGSAYSDLAVSHYPNALLIQRSLVEEGHVPLWSPAILSGYPFAANPLAGLWYPPGWAALLFPLPLGINMLMALHLWWSGLGAYCLLRGEGCVHPAALLGALTFAAMPKLYSHLGAGHVTLVYAVSWTPWLLFAALEAGRYAAREAGFRLHAFMLSGALLGIIALADMRWAAYAGLFWLAYSLRGFRRQDPLRLGGRLTSGAFVALLAAAPQLVPLAEYTRMSTRASMTAAESLVYSLPPLQLFGLIYPYIAGGAEWMLYPGALAVVLSIYAAGNPTARRHASFWLGAAALTMLVALGAALPGMEAASRLPGFDLLRVPPRALFLTGLAFSAAAAHGANVLLTECDPGRQGTRLSLVLFGSAVFVSLLGGAAALLVSRPLDQLRFSWGAGFYLVAAVLVLLARSRHIPMRVAVGLLLALQLVDLSGVNALSLEFRPSLEVLAEGAPAAKLIVTDAGGTPMRVYSPSYSLPQQTAAWYGLELADGVDPLQLAAYARYMDGATGVPRAGYSVTLPPYASGDPLRDNHRYRPDAASLGLLNVGYVVSAFPLDVAGLRLLAELDGHHVYRNDLALPRAWVQPSVAELGQQVAGVSEIQLRADSVTLDAQGPGLLVLAEIAYPGWQVTVDGQPARLESPGGLLRGVLLPDGTHKVEFSFRPWIVILGASLGIFTWLALIIVWILERKRHG